MTTSCTCAACPAGGYKSTAGNEQSCLDCNSYCTPFTYQICVADQLPVCYDNTYNNDACIVNTYYLYTKYGAPVGTYVLTSNVDGTTHSWVMTYVDGSMESYNYVDPDYNGYYITGFVFENISELILSSKSGTLYLNGTKVSDVSDQLQLKMYGNYGGCGGYPNCDATTCNSIKFIFQDNDLEPKINGWYFDQASPDCYFTCDSNASLSTCIQNKPVCTVAWDGGYSGYTCLAGTWQLYATYNSMKNYMGYYYLTHSTPTTYYISNGPNWEKNKKWRYYILDGGTFNFTGDQNAYFHYSVDNGNTIKTDGFSHLKDSINNLPSCGADKNSRICPDTNACLNSGIYIGKIGGNKCFLNFMYTDFELY